MDSVRARKSKFVCINDNIQNKTEELDGIIHDFYNSFFPLPCQFEKGWSVCDSRSSPVEWSRFKHRASLLLHSVHVEVNGKVVGWGVVECLFLLLSLWIVWVRRTRVTGRKAMRRWEVAEKGVQVYHEHESWFLC